MTSLILALPSHGIYIQKDGGKKNKQIKNSRNIYLFNSGWEIIGLGKRQCRDDNQILMHMSIYSLLISTNNVVE